jgi:hypothetical protein
MPGTELAWTATAFVFSGRQDPQWILSAEQSKRWLAHWESAGTSNRQTVIPSILGYRGCKLQKNEHSYWLVHNSCVCLYENDVVICRKDAGRTAELYLLSTGPDTAQLILRQLRTGG